MRKSKQQGWPLSMQIGGAILIGVPFIALIVSGSLWFLIPIILFLAIGVIFMRQEGKWKQKRDKSNQGKGEV